MAKMYTEEEVEIERQKAALISNLFNIRDDLAINNRPTQWFWAIDWALLQLGVKVEEKDETEKT